MSRSLSPVLHGGVGRFDFYGSVTTFLFTVLHIKLLPTLSSTQTEQEGRKCREWERCWIPALRDSYGLKEMNIILTGPMPAPPLSLGLLFLCESCKPRGIEYVCVHLFENRENHISHSFQFTFALLTLEVRLLTLDLL